MEVVKNNFFTKNKPYVIAGPCSAESEGQMLKTAFSIQEFTDVFRAGLWKPRTNPMSFEGVGEKGVQWLQKVKDETSMKVATEIANARHVEICLSADIDMLWIGARTTVNPFYVQEIASALKGVDIPVLVKNPIHPELGLWLGAIERLSKSGIKKIAAVHRGFYSHTKSAYRNDPKWELPIRLKEEFNDMPIICDSSHIAGNPFLIKEISQTSIDLNFDGLMIETHIHPKNALSDSYQQVEPDTLRSILSSLILKDEKTQDEIFINKILKYRSEIDICDKKIIEMLMSRTELVKKIAKLKRENSVTIFQIDRWFEILRTRKEMGASLDLDLQMINELFDLIHKYSISTQSKIINK